MTTFPEIHKNFGFGCMRLPMNGDEVDIPQFSAMVDTFLARGFNYFDTAHGYLSGKSETAIRAGLTSRYPRERYILTDKLTAPYFACEADILPFFESQLASCGVDYDDPAVQAGKCLAVCRRHGKPVIVMEPVKGGNLVRLPEKAQQILDALHGGSNASYAIRYAAGFDEVVMVLSGMSDLAQMEDNLSYMESYKPLDEREMEAVRGVCDVFRSMHLIPCTACRYCTDGCPRHISIPDLFSCMNTKKIYNDWNADYYYTNVHTKNHGKASDCIGCGKCEKACPQHLPIRALLKDVAKEFEK